MHPRPLFALVAAVLCAAPALAQDRPKILLTGYWPPTNNMLRPWSQNPAQNTTGWIGANWEGRGYDIVSYFPEFPGGTTTNPKGNGDLEVDYQDTAADFQRITYETKPVAIITFSRANTSIGWELEPAAQRFRFQGEAQHPTRTIPYYTQDYTGNRYPTDTPIAAEPLGNVRNNTLPMNLIVSSVAATVPSNQSQPFIQTYNPNTPDTFDYGGGFLSGYISYLGMWYKDLNSGPAMSNTPCYAAGHIHVGQGMSLSAATLSTQATLRALTGYLDTTIVPAPGALAMVAFGAVAASRRRR